MECGEKERAHYVGSKAKHVYTWTANRTLPIYILVEMYVQPSMQKLKTLKLFFVAVVVKSITQSIKSITERIIIVMYTRDRGGTITNQNSGRSIDRDRMKFYLFHLLQEWLKIIVIVFRTYQLAKWLDRRRTGAIPLP